MAIAPSQPLVPDALGLQIQSFKGSAICGYPVVGIVTSKFLAESLRLLAHRQVSVLTAPNGDAMQRALKAGFHRLLSHHPVAFQGPTPEMRKSQQIETSLPLTLSLLRGRGRWRPKESNQPCLRWMDA